MDILIKNNIIKKNKLIVDVGMYETKVLEVHYEAKKITVTDRLKVKTIVSSVYNQICLSEIFFDEYEHLNRLFVDFGTNSTSMTRLIQWCSESIMMMTLCLMKELLVILSADTYQASVVFTVLA